MARGNSSSDLGAIQSRLDQEKQHCFSDVEEIFLSGGGGAGMAYPAAMIEAQHYGLDFDKVKVVCAVSAGTIQGLALVLGIPFDQIKDVIDQMPSDKFLDWRLWDIVDNFRSRWALCKGEYMPNYFKELIQTYTENKLGKGQGLWDPTFKELYDAGFDKEFRVVTANLTRGCLTVFSYKNTPHYSVADAVALSCSVPFVFPPVWVLSPEGHLELHTDGGAVKNYPFGVGSDKSTPLKKQLGFVFVNSATGKSLDGQHQSPIQSFFSYFMRVIFSLLFQHPLTMEEPVKERTVAIRIRHNPLRFKPNHSQQAELDTAATEGVRSLVRQIQETTRERLLRELLEKPATDWQNDSLSRSSPALTRRVTRSMARGEKEQENTERRKYVSKNKVMSS